MLNIMDGLKMNEYKKKAHLFQTLSHPARLQILDILRGGEECVCHIQAHLGKRQAYVSQQLMALRNANLVSDRKDGLYVFYRLSEPLVAELLELVLGPVQERTWCEEAACPRCHELDRAIPDPDLARSSL
jgi:DNA-binding transcriptional ArsR family regulator